MKNNEDKFTIDDFKNDNLTEEEVGIINEELDKSFENFIEDIDKEIEADEQLNKEADDIFDREDKKDRYETFIKYHPQLKDLD